MTEKKKLTEEQRSSGAGRESRRTLSASEKKDVNEKADAFKRTIGSNKPPKEEK